MVNFGAPMMAYRPAVADQRDILEQLRARNDRSDYAQSMSSKSSDEDSVAEAKSKASKKIKSFFSGSDQKKTPANEIEGSMAATSRSQSIASKSTGSSSFSKKVKKFFQEVSSPETSKDYKPPPQTNLMIQPIRRAL